MKAPQQEYIINRKGKKTSIIIPIDQYEELLEDLHDLTIVAERKKESTISLEEMQKRLKKRGLL